MTITAEQPSAEKLIDVARETARGMRAVAEGKPADTATHSDARSFIGIARLLDLLVAEVERLDTLTQRRGTALARIADLRIRDGAHLIESGDWHRIAGELREIAGETLAAEPLTGRAGGESRSNDRQRSRQA